MICGIDLGSRQVKLVLMDNNKIMKTMQYDTISFYKSFATKRGNKLLVDFQKIGLPQCSKVISTGYGRLTIAIEGAQTIPEIKAHCLGALYQCKIENFTLLDLGGQDSKIIKVQYGKMVDFITNDKCAASSGRYLENMANILGIELDELGRHFKDPVELNSTCAVFGESELIGKIVEGYSLDNLAAGVNYTIFKRIKPLLYKMGYEKVIFVGGVAKNTALAEILKKELNSEIIIPSLPQYNGAIGCCLYSN